MYMYPYTLICTCTLYPYMYINLTCTCILIYLHVSIFYPIVHHFHVMAGSVSAYPITAGLCPYFS